MRNLHKSLTSSAWALVLSLLESYLLCFHSLLLLSITTNEDGTKKKTICQAGSLPSLSLRQECYLRSECLLHGFSPDHLDPALNLWFISRPLKCRYVWMGKYGNWLWFSISVAPSSSSDVIIHAMASTTDFVY